MQIMSFSSPWPWSSSLGLHVHLLLLLAFLAVLGVLAVLGGWWKGVVAESGVEDGMVQEVALVVALYTFSLMVVSSCELVEREASPLLPQLTVHMGCFTFFTFLPFEPFLLPKLISSTFACSNLFKLSLLISFESPSDSTWVALLQVLG